VIEAALLLLFLVSEPVRLALGYSGNLQEKVPFVAAFMLLTLFPGLPVCLYFMFVQKVRWYDGLELLQGSKGSSAFGYTFCATA
jgi:hypothetical protein